MEAWKFIDYTAISPLYALSLTTERWGLDPFPGNTVASNLSLQTAQTSSNHTVQIAVEVWTLPYDCSSSLYFSDSYYLDSSLQTYHNNLSNSSGNVEFCSEPCAKDGCLILIEDIGRIRTGPKQASIVGLSYGISTLLAFLFTFLIIMGCIISQPKPVRPEPKPVQQRERQLYNPSPPPPRPRPVQRYAEQAASPENLAKEVVKCAGMLREMYALDLLIWGQKNAIKEDVPKREDNKRRSNALFGEICRIVNTWKGMNSMTWSVEERTHIEEICNFLDRQDRTRYDV